jgi:hypothetical protein
MKLKAIPPKPALMYHPQIKFQKQLVWMMNCIHFPSSHVTLIAIISWNASFIFPSLFHAHLGVCYLASRLEGSPMTYYVIGQMGWCGVGVRSLLGTGHLLILKHLCVNL